MMNKALFLFFFLTGAAYGAYSPSTIITDPAGVNQATVKGASTAPTATDKALVVAMSPNSSCSVTGTFWQSTQPVSSTQLPSALDGSGYFKVHEQGTANVSVQNASLAVTGTFWQATQPVSATSLPLPSGAATSANQSTEISSLSTIATNTGKSPISTTGSGSAAAATVSTVITLSAPANAVGFILQNLDTSTANIRWAVGRTASATLGQQLQPGRDTGFVPVGANVSLVSESGTQNYDIQWVSQ